MIFTKVVPNIFYVDINDALRLFIDCLEFTIEHDELTSEQRFCLIEKNGLRINLFENEALAKEHNQELRLVTNNIDEVYKKVASRYISKLLRLPATLMLLLPRESIYLLLFRNLFF